MTYADFVRRWQCLISCAMEMVPIMPPIEEEAS